MEPSSSAPRSRQDHAHPVARQVLERAAARVFQNLLRYDERRSWLGRWREEIDGGTPHSTGSKVRLWAEKRAPLQ